MKDEIERDEKGELKTPREQARKMIVEHVHEFVDGKKNDEPSDETNDEDETVEELKSKLAERETQLGIIAQHEFEKQAKDVKKKIKKQLNRDVTIENPEELEFAKSLLEEESEQDDESPSIYKGGSDLSQTGKFLSGEPPKKTSGYKTGKDVIDALYDAYEEELFKKETGKPYDAQRLALIEKQIDILWSKVKEGIENRQGNILGRYPKGLGTICRKCGQVTFKRICENCGHETMSENEWNKGR